eukprot:9680250-Alexandrium_andersonii.AAC.1
MFAWQLEAFAGHGGVCRAAVNAGRQSCTMVLGSSKLPCIASFIGRQFHATKAAQHLLKLPETAWSSVR